MEGLCLMPSSFPSRSTPMADFSSWNVSSVTPLSSSFDVRPIQSVNNSRVEQIARHLIEENNIRIPTSGVSSTNGFLQGASASRPSVLRQNDVADLLSSTDVGSRSLWDTSFPQGSALFEDALKNLQSLQLETQGTTIMCTNSSSVFSSESMRVPSTSFSTSGRWSYNDFGNHVLPLTMPVGEIDQHDRGRAITNRQSSFSRAVARPTNSQTQVESSLVQGHPRQLWPDSAFSSGNDYSRGQGDSLRTSAGMPQQNQFRPVGFNQGFNGWHDTRPSTNSYSTHGRNCFRQVPSSSSRTQVAHTSQCYTQVISHAQPTPSTVYPRQNPPRESRGRVILGVASSMQSNSDPELNSQIERCAEQVRLLSGERRRAEEELSYMFPDKKITGNNNIPIPRLPDQHARIDKLVIDELKELTKVLTLYDTMAILAELHPTIRQAVNNWKDSVQKLQQLRINQRSQESMAPVLLQDRHKENMDSVSRSHILLAVKELTSATRTARTAFWCAYFSIAIAHKANRRGENGKQQQDKDSVSKFASSASSCSSSSLRSSFSSLGLGSSQDANEIGDLPLLDLLSFPPSTPTAPPKLTPRGEPVVPVSLFPPRDPLSFSQFASSSPSYFPMRNQPK